MNIYNRLSFKEREEISRLLASGKSPAHIAKTLGRHRSTVSREIAAGSCNRYTYRAVKADKRAKRNAARRRAGKNLLSTNARLQRYVIAKLRLRWSPEQIAESLERAYPHDRRMRISPETIYTTLYVLPKGTLKKELLSSLRRGHQRRRRRKTGIQPIIERSIENMALIDERPQEVDERIVPGHWEGDLLIGKNRQSALGSLTERTTRMLFLVPLVSKSSNEVAREFQKRLNRLPLYLRRTLTYDQGREMAKHEQLAEQARIKVFFAHKASPWERGTNENTNGLVRQFFPKGTDFSKISRPEIRRVERLLNGRPRKVLQWQTPHEVFHKLLR